MGYAYGRVQVGQAGALNKVTALWEVRVSTASYGFAPNAPLHFLTSGGTTAQNGFVRAHDRLTGRLTFALVSPPPANLPGMGVTADGGPVAFEQIRGPGEVLASAAAFGPNQGTTESGTGSTLTDSTSRVPNVNWGVNALAGKWCCVRPTGGGGATQWARILSNTATVLTFETAVSPIVGAGQRYQIFEELQLQLLGFFAGTPQDWVAAGVEAGDLFTLDGSSYYGVVASVAARELTLEANWPGPADNNEGYGIVMDRTTNYNLPRDFVRIANRPAVLTDAMDKIDAAIAAAGGGGGGPGIGTRSLINDFLNSQDVEFFNTDQLVVIASPSGPLAPTTNPRLGVLYMPSAGHSNYIVTVGGTVGPPWKGTAAAQMHSTGVGEGIQLFEQRPGSVIQSPFSSGEVDTPRTTPLVFNWWAYAGWGAGPGTTSAFFLGMVPTTARVIDVAGAIHATTMMFGFYFPANTGGAIRAVLGPNLAVNTQVGTVSATAGYKFGVRFTVRDYLSVGTANTVEWLIDDAVVHSVNAVAPLTTPALAPGYAHVRLGASSTDLCRIAQWGMTFPISND